MTEFKHYCDLQIIREVPTIDHDEVIASSDSIDLVELEWIEYMSDETMARYQYTDREKGKKYEHRFGYTLEILMPNSLTTQELAQISTEFMNNLLKGSKKVSWIAEKRTRGQGSYLFFTLSLAKKYKNAKEIKSFYTADVYRDAETGYFAKSTHPNAVLIAQKGDLKGSIMSNWSKKIRLFEGSKAHFNTILLPLIRTLVLKVINKVKKVRVIAYLSGIKHKILKNERKSVYYNRNIRAYNAAMYQINCFMQYWNDVIYYQTDTTYYQDSNITSAWFALVERYKRFTRNKRFNYETLNKKLKLSISPWIQSDVFEENINSFTNQFMEHLNLFLKEYIY